MRTRGGSSTNLETNVGESGAIIGNYNPSFSRNLVKTDFVSKILLKMAVSWPKLETLSPIFRIKI